MAELLKIDNTKRNTFVSCPRKYYFRFILGLYQDKGSTPLRYGSVWHDTLEAFYEAIKVHGWNNDGKAVEDALVAAKKSWDKYTGKHEFYPDHRTLENLATSFLEYLTHFAADEGFLEVVETESLFQIETHWDSEVEEVTFPDLEPFIFTGKKDLMVRLNNQLWTYEHKTTGWSLKMIQKSLHRSAQVMGYSWAGKIEYPKEEPTGVLVSYHYLSAYKSKKTGLYGKPKIDFERVPQIYTNEDLGNWRLSFLSVVEQIQREMKRGLWPMGHDSCYQYGRCGFCNVCEMNRDIYSLTDNVPYGYYLDKPWEVTESKG